MSRVTRYFMAFHVSDRLLLFTLVPNVPLVAMHRGILSVSALALFYFFHLVVGRLVSIWAGYVSDQKSPRWMLVWGFAISTASYILLCASETAWQLMIAGIGAGLGTGLSSTMITGMLAHRREQLHEALNFSYHYFFINVAALAGPLLFWPLLGRWALSLILVPVALLAYFWRAPDFAADLDRRSPEERRFFESLRMIARDGFILRMILFLSTFWAAFTLLFSSVPVIAEGLGGHYNGNVWFALNAGTIIVCHYLVTRLVSHRHQGRVALMGFALGFVGTTLIAWSPQLWILIVGVIILSLGELCSTPATMNIMTRAAPPAMRVQYISLLWVAGALGEGGGQALLAILPEARTSCLIVAGSILVGILWFRPYLLRLPHSTAIRAPLAAPMPAD